MKFLTFAITTLFLSAAAVHADDSASSKMGDEQIQTQSSSTLHDKKMKRHGKKPFTHKEVKPAVTENPPTENK